MDKLLRCVDCGFETPSYHGWTFTIQRPCVRWKNKDGSPSSVGHNLEVVE